jgi:transposase-like protein
MKDIIKFATKIMLQIKCPYCSYTRFWRLRREKKKCKKCKREYTSKTYPVNGFRITPNEWKKVIQIFLRQRTIKSITSSMNIGQNTAQRMTHHMRVCMSEYNEKIFSGPIELDETYIGGQRKNKKLHIRRRPCKRGHGTDKLPIMGIFDRETGKVYIEVLKKKLDMYHIINILDERVEPGSTIYTDGYKMYRMLPKYGYNHSWVDHDGGELVRGSIHTNNIEGFWGILKRKLGCIGGMRRERLYLFVGEIVWIFNHRNLPMEEKEKALQNIIFHKTFGGRN